MRSNDTAAPFNIGLWHRAWAWMNRALRFAHGAQFTYSRWDGTQRGFDLDADALFDELTDDLLYHGDVNTALRRMMQQGMRDRNGERLAGIRELIEQLRA